MIASLFAYRCATGWFPSPASLEEFQPEFLLGPQNHGIAVQERHDGALDLGGIVAAEGRDRGHDVAFIVVGDRQDAVVAIGDPIGSAQPFHPACLDDAAAPLRLDPWADERGVADALELFVIGDAGRAVAVAYLGTD